MFNNFERSYISNINKSILERIKSDITLNESCALYNIG